MTRIPFIEFSGGMQRRTSRLLKRDNECDIIVNFHGDKIGARTKRLGYSQVGDTLQANKSVLGQHGYYVKAGTDYHLATINNSAATQSVLKYNNAGTWTDITGATTLPASVKSEFATFIDYAFIVGGRTMTTGSLTGTTYSTTTNVTNAPKAKYCIVYKDRLYLLNCNTAATNFPSRFYYSSLPTGAPLAITWNVTEGTGDYEAVDEDDGEELMGGTVNGNNLILFKETSMHAWNNSALWQIDAVGCASHRSIQTVGAITYFLGQTDEGYSLRVYAGGISKPISGRIQDIFDGLTYAQASGSFSAHDSDHYYLYVGDLTIDGETFTNCEVVYKFSTGEFWINSFYDNFTCYTSMRSSNLRRIYAGCADGEIMQRARTRDAVYSDDTFAINGYLKTRRYDLQLPEQQKGISKIHVLCDEPQGMLVNVKLDNQNRIEKGRKVYKEVSSFDMNATPGYDFQVEISESSTNPPCSFLGFVVELKQESKK